MHHRLDENPKPVQLADKYNVAQHSLSGRLLLLDILLVLIGNLFVLVLLALCNRLHGANAVIELLLALVQQGSAEVDNIVIVISQVGQCRDELAHEVGVQLGERGLCQGLVENLVDESHQRLGLLPLVDLGHNLLGYLQEVVGRDLVEQRLEGLLRKLLLWVS